MNNVAWAEAEIDPQVALALLESLRAADIPTEHLKDEDLQQSLPRRLGLSPVVDANIRRYLALRREGGSLRAQEVGELFQLVSRRPDARAVFADAGRHLAHDSLSRHRRKARSIARGLPSAARRRLGLRSVLRLARQLAPGGLVRLELRPPSLAMEGGLIARACGSDAGCLLLNSAFEHSMETYAAVAGPVLHIECEGRGDRQCLWRAGSD
ncbi:MAG: hypothetical protein JSV95_10795 [Gemmatimonadota bacterium]|nr:MAG: hypothetical protein JSV95_10795 [Gemmatimonadota bacterium]